MGWSFFCTLAMPWEPPGALWLIWRHSTKSGTTSRCCKGTAGSHSTRKHPGCCGRTNCGHDPQTPHPSPAWMARITPPASCLPQATPECLGAIGSPDP